MYSNNNNVTYFDSFGVEHITKEIGKLIDRYLIKATIFRTQAYHSIMRGFGCIEFIDILFEGKGLIYFTNLFHQIIKKKKIYTIYNTIYLKRLIYTQI